MPRAKSTGRRLARDKENRKKICKNCGHPKGEHFGRSYNPCGKFEEISQ